jgi:hypothetical protein
MKHLLKNIGVGVVTGLLLSVARVEAQFAVDWFTIDGGGGASTGGVYAVSGTIGQPDAGVMSGGQFSLAGGFWGAVSAIQTLGAPLLSIEWLGGGSVRVFWPLPATDFVLDCATNLVSAPATNAWSPLPAPYQTNAAHISITVPVPEGKKFFRLRRQ